MSEELYIRIGIIICGSVIWAWYFITNKIEKNIRYLLISTIIILNIFEVIRLKQWDFLIGMFWLVISGVFCLVERFPKSKTSYINKKKRREQITFWEDYLFVVGVAMLGIEEWMRMLILNIKYG